MLSGQSVYKVTLAVIVIAMLWISVAVADTNEGLDETVLRGDLPAVERAILKGTNVNGKNGNGSTVLYIASENSHKTVVRLLLAKGANVNAKTADNLATPLHVAAQEGHREIAELLLAKGAEVNAKTSTDGVSAPGLASQNGHKEIRELLFNAGAK
jgi:ankyrin repeat protein